MSLVMRLETAAAKQDQKVREKFEYNATAADLRELLFEAARRIKELECKALIFDVHFSVDSELCGND